MVSEVGQFYSGAVGQFYIGANNPSVLLLNARPHQTPRWKRAKGPGNEILRSGRRLEY